MAHDVYICYDEMDKQVGEEICNIFEENNIKTWIKSRDFSSDDSVDKITNAISDSKCFILIYSKNSKDTNYVITEVDIAFSRDIPILIFNIDDIKISKNMQFILESKKMIYSFPDTKKQLVILVKDTSNIINKPINNVKINSKSLRVLGRVNPKRKENLLKKYVKIAIPVAVILILIYLFVILPMGQNSTEDGIFSMNVTGVDVSGTKYVVHGQSFNMPSNPSNYFMNIKFFDAKDNMIFEVNSTADEFKSGVICNCDVHTNNITHIEFKLRDINNNLLSNETYVIK